MTESPIYQNYLNAWTRPLQSSVKWLMITSVKISLCFLPILAISSVNAAEISGPVKIVDGDTVKILGVPIRLEGIDAPETAQTCKKLDGREYGCGKKSVDYLRHLLGKEARCEGSKYDKYRRLLATCYSGKVNVNREMVINGWAVAFLRYSDVYTKEEKLAKVNRRGIWNGEFVRPSAFRAGAWREAESSNDVGGNGQCAIKGNINRKGEKIYHTPWSRNYKRTQINTSKSERWFCSETEAKNAGWRAAYR